MFSETPKGNGKNGEKIFKTKCAQCHVVEKYGSHKQHEIKKKRKKKEDYLLLQMRFPKNLWKNLFVVHNINNDCYKLGLTFSFFGDN